MEELEDNDYLLDLAASLSIVDENGLNKMNMWFEHNETPIRVIRFRNLKENPNG